MKDGEKNNGAKVAPDAGFTAEEKAQYEVFRNGEIPRDTIRKYVENDLRALASFVHIVRSESAVFEVLVDAMWSRYVKLHKGEKK